MGRAKKATKTEKLDTTKTNQAENNTTSTNWLKYTGKVKVSVQVGKTVLSTKEYHNEGGAELFKFFCYCLTGDYSAASKLRPCRLQLFLNEAETPSSASEYSNKLIDLSNKILYAQTPTAKYETNEKDPNGNWTTTLHFVIPFTQLLFSKLATPVMTINQARLYADDPNISKLEYCANDLFVTKGEDGLQWDPIIIDATKNANVTIVLDWTLSVGNN